MLVVSPNKPYSGFTLLELLVTLAIVSVLMVISYPIYTQHVLKARRAHAEIALLNAASTLEHYYLFNHTYKGATIDTKADIYADSKAYHIDIYKATRDDYEIRATPEGAQIKDEVCGTLILDESGKKGITGSGSVANCW